MWTNIKATKDLYNGGRCFTKGHIYKVRGALNNTAGLMDRNAINDMGEAHYIGSWWRDFKIVKVTMEEWV